jgi:hypothetical protein
MLYSLSARTSLSFMARTVNEEYQEGSAGIRIS